MKVSVIKHSHHQVEFEPKHKDSAPFRLGGAHEVMVVSPYRWGIFAELTDESEPDVDACISRLVGPDLVLIEGFRRSHYPKLEVYRPELSKPPIFESNDSINVVASPVRSITASAISNHAYLDLDDPMQIAFWILKNVLQVKESVQEQAQPVES